MPGRQLPDNNHPVDTTPCRRCQEVESAIVVRTEPVCKSCFSKYVQTKIVKRLETFRVRHSEPGNERTLLLPLSYTASSVTLLHVLSQHLQGQTEKTGRTGFKLCVLHIYGGSSPREDDEAPFADLKARYPQHDYHTAHLSSALASSDIARLFTTPSSSPLPSNPTSTLHSLLHNAPSPTSRQDISQTLHHHLTLAFAKSHACAAILWDHSATKLAERTISETAKGRGLVLPWIVADGVSLHGIPFYHPLRDLLNKELASYISFVDPPFSFTTTLLDDDVKPIVSAKNTTIDDLVAAYFASVEREYPSIVANVVRTTAKLPVQTLMEEQAERCELCCVPLQGRAPERSRLCRGCIRMLPQEKAEG